MLLYIPALIGDSFHPLSSSACDDMLLFLCSERTLRTSVPVFIHTAVSLLSPPRQVKPSYSLLTLDLDFWPWLAVALLRGLNNTWIYPFVIKKRGGVEGGNVTLTVSYQQHSFSFYCLLNVIILSLQLFKEIEISPKDTRVIRFDKAESCTIGYGTLPSDCSFYWSCHSRNLLDQIDFIIDVEESYFVNNWSGMTQSEWN